MITPSIAETITSFNILITLICHLEPKPYNLETKKVTYVLDCVEHSYKYADTSDNFDLIKTLDKLKISHASVGRYNHVETNKHTLTDKTHPHHHDNTEHNANNNTVTATKTKHGNFNDNVLQPSDVRKTAETTVGETASDAGNLTIRTEDSNSGVNANGNSEGATVNLQKRGNSPTTPLNDEMGSTTTGMKYDDDVTQTSGSDATVDGITFQSNTESHEFHITRISDEINVSNGEPDLSSPNTSPASPRSSADSSSLGPATTINTVASPNQQPLLAILFQAKLETTSPNEVTYVCSNTSCDVNNTMDPLARLVLLNDLADVGEILIRNVNLDDPYDWGYVVCELQEPSVVNNTSVIASSKFFICSIRTRWKQFEYDWKYLFAIIFIGAGGVGNILVCLAVCLDKSLQNVTNYFLLSLALADLLVSVIVMPLGAIPGFLGYWPLSVRWCNVYLTSDVLACSCSIMHMCCISLGRYLGIRNPLKTRHTYSTKKLVGIKITIVWCLSLSVGGSITLLGLYNPNNIMQAGKRCAINNRAFFLFGSLVAFYIPMLIMVISYALTVQLLRKKARFLMTGDSSGPGGKGGGPPDIPTFRTLGGKNNKLKMPQPVNQKVDQQTQTPQMIDKFRFPPAMVNLFSLRWFKHIKTAQRRRTRQSSSAVNSVRTEQKASKVLGLVFFTFVLCWAPFFLLQIMQAICPVTYCRIPDDLSIVCLWLGYFSSILNPIIYTIFNRTFRAAFIRLLKCKCRLVTKPIRYRSVNDRATASSSGPAAANVVLSMSPSGGGDTGGPSSPLLPPGKTLSVSTQDLSPVTNYPSGICTKI
uniref:5-hydroxytryptamine receptor 2A n=1 Tax=Cacopsylla melanoneura TaxID=428564 RepID=A0A8D8SXR4_9HEMI